MSDKHILVEMKLLPETVALVERLQKQMGASNRTDAVARSLELARLVVQAIEDGSRVYVETAAGDRRRLVVPYLGD